MLRIEEDLTWRDVERKESERVVSSVSHRSRRDGEDAPVKRRLSPPTVQEYHWSDWQIALAILGWSGVESMRRERLEGLPPELLSPSTGITPVEGSETESIAG